MYTAVELTRSMVTWAAMVATESDDLSHVVKAAAPAKPQVALVAGWSARAWVQLHGGIGDDRRDAVGHLTARLTAIDHLLGDGRQLTNQLAAQLTDVQALLSRSARRYGVTAQGC